jgi:hypothetical protein
MAKAPIPPTYLQPVAKDPVTGREYFEPAWLQFFLDLAQILTTAGGTTGIDHESLLGLLGGSAGGHYHLTSAEHSKAADGTGAAVQTPAIGASPAVIQNTNAYCVSAVVSVLASVTDVSVSKDGVTYYSLGLGRAVTLGPSHFIKLTYPGAAPTLVFLPL